MKNKRPIIYLLLSSILFALYCGIGEIVIRSLYSEHNAFPAAMKWDMRSLVFPAGKVYASEVSDETLLIPGGNAFGVKIYAEGLICVGFADVEKAKGSPTPALDAGLKVGDIITKVDGEGVTTAEDFVSYVEKSGGKEIKIEFKRGERRLEGTLRPSLSGKDEKYRVGMWVRDSTAGIGTVTYVFPETLCFGGLGHGICDSISGEVVPLSRGSVADVSISSVVRGLCGTPGELKGSFTSGRRGALLSNTENGVFGAYSSLPEELKGREAIPIARRGEVKDGEAQILCTLGDDGIGTYTISVSDIDRGDTSSKSFTVTVTDEELIRRTGGIVQGMSGSPIIQDGKLVGAVTHVLISDPTKGYGIFIENMLEAAG